TVSFDTTLSSFSSKRANVRLTASNRGDSMTTDPILKFPSGTWNSRQSPPQRELSQHEIKMIVSKETVKNRLFLQTSVEETKKKIIREVKLGNRDILKDPSNALHIIDDHISRSECKFVVNQIDISKTNLEQIIISIRYTQRFTTNNVGSDTKKLMELKVV